MAPPNSTSTRRASGRSAYAARIPDSRSATAIVHIGVADLDALNAAFAIPGIEELISRRQARYPYQVVWANHDPPA
ncbi:hypothetical protein [Streptomyces sp. NPDC008139]|uniref:hypothetical protein n=1 Tax=Streptomyces sp. NPDC008139 TaxID=3364814 RepID=UPI0036DFD80F